MESTQMNRIWIMDLTSKPMKSIGCLTDGPKDTGHINLRVMIFLKIILRPESLCFGISSELLNRLLVTRL